MQPFLHCTHPCGLPQWFGMQRIGSLLAMALALLPGALGAQPALPPDYRGGLALDIPFANGPISAAHAPQVWLTLAGNEPRRFGLDTGSTGIVVSAAHYQPAPQDSDDGPGRLVYTSSGRILIGRRHTTDVTIHRDRATPLVRTRVQVLRVTEIACLARARDCRPEHDPRGVSYMGIGFDRGAAQGTPDAAPRNPFLNLTELASGSSAAAVRRAYLLTRSGVQLGLTADSTRAFGFVALASRGVSPGGRPLWQAAPVTVSVDDVAGAGNVLVDTGIPSMFLSPPAGSGLAAGRRAPAGTRIALWLPDSRMPRAHYAFTVGESDNLLQPDHVEMVQDRTVFVNTGRLFLEGFDYLYDADGGHVGYRWTGRASAAVGGVTPGVTAR